MNDLRRSIIETFLSIIHGMQQSAYKGIIMRTNYAADILNYIDLLLNKPNFDTNDEFVKNVCNLYIDITEIYGTEIRGTVWQTTGAEILCHGLKNLNFAGLMASKTLYEFRKWFFKFDERLASFF